MLTTADDDVGPASFEGLAAAGQDAADRLGETVTARDAVTDEVDRHVWSGLSSTTGRRSIKTRTRPPRPHPRSFKATLRGGLFL